METNGIYWQANLQKNEHAKVIKKIKFWYCNVEVILNTLSFKFYTGMRREGTH